MVPDGLFSENSLADKLTTVAEEAVFDTFKGTGGTLEKATDRACAAYSSRSSSIKKERRAKEAFREELLEHGY